ncbi:uncharacterized protein KGF55_002416 [Candida pseudojiufengensis]|uniref:uncharacterized protein n=1 Tax=Candida pseudojiufengensis TaxID=497109 RepID=UPI00222492E5|nr:uncharacterized protein KGF55_002416 [Candida pseudojiufengensis]KAI5963536.1 hypothetical protein KGF55_002416 [Candida pseudojiufengensis]
MSHLDPTSPTSPISPKSPKTSSLSSPSSIDANLKSPNSRRRSSINSNEEDPYALAEKYYGDHKKKTFGKDSPLSRVRTFSTFESQTTKHDFLKKLNEQHPISDTIKEQSEPPSSSGSKSPTPSATSTSTSSSNTLPQPTPGKVNFNLNIGKDKDEHEEDDESPNEVHPTNNNEIIPKPINNDQFSKINLSHESLSSENERRFIRQNTEQALKKPSIVPLYEDESQAVTPIQSNKLHYRRASLDDTIIRPKKYYISDVQETLKELLESEDTDNNCQITIEDTGPKVLRLGTANSNGYKSASVRGTYMLSNLLQELTIASRFGRRQIVLDEARLNENPVNRMKRLISTSFWKNLSRQVTSENIVEMSKDTKIKETWVDENGVKHEDQESHRIYVPYNRKDQYDFFMKIKNSRDDIHLDVQYLPKKIDADYIKSINKKPGLLSLASRVDPKNPDNLISWPYVVPGGRFNELYGWDSYMETLGLLTDVSPNKNLDHLEYARGMAENFIYEIDHYGKILNANRSYYLGRSQPPFLTDMALRIFNKSMEVIPEEMNDLLDFLKRATLAAIKEYETVWCCPPRLDKKTGLSCYYPEGKGIPPETEASHFTAVLKEYVDKYGITQEEFIEKYNNGEIIEPDLDNYFLHDRAVRESGHDTSYRLEGKCAWLATVDLNSLLYKYENDIAFIITTFFNDRLEGKNGESYSSDIWLKRATERKANVNKYLWNEKDSMYYDYNVHDEKQEDYESATTFWPLYSKLASTEQAAKLIDNSIPKLEEHGGLVAGTLKSRGEVGLSRPSRQWDFPFGWAPQQILAWIGLTNYGYDGIARRLAYRWLFMMTKSFVDYNGVVVEKYNVTKGAVPHRVDAEYGNQGLDFKGVATEGFGWVNASYLFGLTFLDLYAQRALGTLTPPDVFFRNMHPTQRRSYQ